MHSELPPTQKMGGKSMYMWLVSQYSFVPIPIAGSWAESCLGRSCGMGARHVAMAIGPTRPVKALSPSPTQCGAPQHCLTPRGAEWQGYYTQLSGIRPLGMSSGCKGELLPNKRLLKAESLWHKGIKLGPQSICWMSGQTLSVTW